MKLTIKMILVAVMIAATAGIATADPGSRADRRQAKQQVRIAQGVRSGELTRAEARRLRAGQRHVRRVERRAKADGVVTPRERMRLHRALDRQSRAIYRLEHNARSR